MPYQFDSESLIQWFEAEKRDLPWRENATPYRVWVSEVMLQQTQVSVVIPYYEQWMERFPSIQALAAADLDEVIKAWEGLGYYSRARNLHRGAKTVCELFGGELPNTEEDLAKIKGLGPYTIGAIRSFAFRQRASAVDGNVLRVVTRYFHITDDISKGSTVKNIRGIVEDFLPKDKHWIVNEGLIELGATVCGKTARCLECPLKKSCLSYLRGTVQEVPHKSARFSSIPIHRAVAVLTHKGCFLLRRGQKGKIMEGLYEFPYFETSNEGISVEALSEKIGKSLGLQGVEHVQSLPSASQSFTKYRVKLQPVLFSLSRRKEIEGYTWVPMEEVGGLAFSSGHRKILKGIAAILDLPHRA